MKLRAFILLTLVLLTAWSSASACGMLDRTCWESKRSGVAGLAARNRSCEDMLMDVDGVAQQALRHLYARDQVFSPSGRGVDYDNATHGVGYIDHADVVEIEREIIMIVNVAIREVRMARYDGANVRSCADITTQARSQIEQIQAALP